MEAIFMKSISGSFDRQFADIFASIDRNREEIEKTVAAVSLVYVQDVRDVTTELRNTSLAYQESTRFPFIFYKSFDYLSLPFVF
jgi:hypothetical protein